MPEAKVPVPISRKVAAPPAEVPEAPKKIAREERVSIAVPKRKVSPPPEVSTEEEHWAMSEEVSISLHTEEEISYAGMNGLKAYYVKICTLSFS
nr:titin-like [Columba livia]